MPSRTTSRRRRAYLNSDDLLVRLISLPEAEQENVLSVFNEAIETAEARVVDRNAILYHARCHQNQPETFAAA
jgi:hypothetical protein